MSRALDPNQEYPLRGPSYLKFLLNDKIAAMFIGKGGSLISELELQTSSSIKLGPTGTHYPTTQDRTVVVGCGSVSGLKEVVRQALRVQREFGVPPLYLRILVSAAACPMIIGRGGETIRSLCNTFNLSIKIQDRIEGLGERIIDVRGGHEGEIIEGVMAIHEINQKEAIPAEYASVLYPYHSGNFEDKQQGRTREGPRQIRGEPKEQRPQPPTIELLSHPSKIAFLVPEKCRLALKDCALIEQQVEGVKIALSPKDEFDCNVEIDGPLASVQAAHILVIKLVTDRLLQEQTFAR
jgi:hypothetical protein